jgi:predicted HD phosphohydrolase
MKTIVGFRRMADGTREDYLLLEEYERDFAAGLPDRVLAALDRLDHSFQGYPVTRLQHSLQTATRAEAAGADEELVLGALLHDVGDDLSPYNHAELAAAILRPYVRPEVAWIVEQHGLFQTYYYVHHLGGDRHQRERLKGHRWYDACVAFCEWDQASFDPDYATRPLAHFEPLLRRILSREAHDPRYVAVES